MEVLKSKEELNKFFVETCRGDQDKLQKELETLAFPKLSVVAKALSMKVAGDKKSIAKALSDKIVKSIDKVKLPPLPEVTTTEDPPCFQVKINPDYLELVPRASKQDYEATKHSIETSGLDKKIEILEDGTIVDGHTRYQILQELDIFSVAKHTVVLNIPQDEVESYIFRANFARRQLSDYAKIAWVKKYLPKIKIKVQAQRASNISDTKQGRKPKKAPKEKLTVRAETAKAAGVSEAQQKKYDFLETYAPDLLKDIESEELTLTGAYTKASKWFTAVKEDEGLFKKVKDGKITLEEAHLKLMEKPVEKKEEKRKAGPLEKQALNIRKIFVKVMTQKYTNEKLDSFDEYEKDFLQRLDLIIATNVEKNL